MGVLPTCTYVYRVHASWLQRPEECDGPLELELQFRAAIGGWESNPAHLEEQPVPLTDKPSLQTPDNSVVRIFIFTIWA